MKFLDEFFNSVLEKCTTNYKNKIINIQFETSLFLVHYFAQKNKKALFVYKNEKVSHDAYNLLKRSSKIDSEEGFNFLLYPAWDILFGERLSPSFRIISQRIIAQKKDAPLISSVKAILSPKEDNFQRFFLKKNIEIDREELINLLSKNYTRKSLCELPGDFAVRGMLLDVFPFYSEDPIRLIFSDNTISAIKYFNPEDQRTIKEVDSFNLIVIEALKFLPDEKEKIRKFFNALSKEERDIISEEIKNIENDINFSGIENYLYFKNDLQFILDDFDTIFFVDKDQVQSEATRLLQEIEKLRSFQIENKIYVKMPSFVYKLIGNPENLATKDFNLDERFKIIDFNTELIKPLSKEVKTAPLLPRGRPEDVKNTLNWYLNANYTVEISMNHIPDYLKDLENTQLIFSERNYPAGIEILGINKEITKKYSIKENLIIFTSQEFSTKQTKEKITRHKNISSLQELQYNDLVVHTDHGIGRFIGLKLMNFTKIQREYAQILYKDGDILYIPVEEFTRLSKYIGPDDAELSSLRSNDWTSKKKRAKDFAEKIAHEIVFIEASRRNVQRPIYSNSKNPTIEELELKESFGYEETPDQERAIEDVFIDMSKPYPMDRLIVADAGFGKTEIAIRAAYRAVLASRQVALLAPTTLLADQHYRTFKNRFDPLGVRVEVLSRISRSGNKNKILEDLKENKIDIIIGTHSLLSKGIKFKNLGLLIIDEEQKFGVMQKEQFKKLRTELDVLSLSATPIPRTLNMALSGLRDISTIFTPPKNRMPIRTIVSPFKDTIVREAILRELDRGGQIFVVDARISNLNNLKEKIESIVGNVSCAVLHGQKSPQEISTTLERFLNKEIDLLISTAILESGLDIPEVNTIIINNADLFGLSELYQLRGRVGRSFKQGYAYFLYSSDKKITEDAKRRLQTIQMNSALVSGFNISLKDMEIRGTGNVLGTEQHGHMENIGVELFTEMIAEELARIKGTAKEFTRVRAEIELYIDKNYINEEGLRIDLYKRLQRVDSEEELFSLQEEIEDRFGKMPKELSNLFLLTLIKLKATKIGIKELSILKDSIKIAPNTTNFLEKIKKNGFFVKSTKEEIVVRPTSPIDSLGFAISILSSLSS
ncbi:transcription-repair coupling factor [Thermodesulfobium narugense DSM 14796]|uniref:Transcription-repair-coupling factor n=1 Tax=Thermodesulfobium narugense DSM 14796 TaxID=747365 RepID=M1E7C9_9BACT|nr:transcription-repair coupling factor [Thermodesulfobium narugense]AEE13924.1 transcription-repair coupling factor [Thermodesulfobium narugense DSM 14796]